MLKISSFDVFDTVLTRSFAAPKDLFDELGVNLADQGFIACSGTQFQISRLEAEQKARRLVASKEVTLDDIYSKLKKNFAWSDQQVILAMRLEIELEKKSLRAVPSMSALIHKARFHSRSIWFLSDMYLPSSVISEVLKREGILQEKDRLVVSAESGVSKHEGSMYARLIQELGKTKYDWEHIGDNRHADYTMPKRFGIKAKLFTGAALSHREDGIRQISEGKSVFKSRFAGAMRTARLQATHENPEAPLHLINSSGNIAGPLVFAFVWWILRSSQELKIERLYFVSRDGQILASVAQALQKIWKFPTEIRYLYGSRQAWHLPGITSLENEHLKNWHFVGPDKLTTSKVFIRLGFKLFEMQEIKTFFSDLNIDFDEINPELLLRTLRSEVLSEKILQKASRQRELLETYLKQEKFFDGCKSAIVDVGWHGNLQRSLTQSIKAMGQSSELLGFYLGLFDSKLASQDQKVYPFYNTISGRPFPSEAASILELFLTGDHGSVVRYEETNGHVEPVLQSIENNSALQWGLHYHQKAIVTSAEELAGCFAFNSSELDLVAKLATKSFFSFFYKPLPEEAEIWRKLPFGSNQEDSLSYSLVPNLSKWEATLAIGFPSRRPGGFWLGGSAALRQSPIAKPYIFLRKFKQKAIIFLKSFKKTSSC
jgi:predicted HAD superfamily hydrolase